MRYHFQFFLGSRDLNLGLPICTANAYSDILLLPVKGFYSNVHAMISACLHTRDLLSYPIHDIRLLSQLESESISATTIVLVTSVTVYICVYKCIWSWMPKEGLRCFGTGDGDGCALPCGCWELNPGLSGRTVSVLILGFS